MFSERLKELRKSKKITQVAFAKQFNIASGTIGMWETGKRQPDYETLTKLADYFNVSVDYLLGRSDDKIDDTVLDKVNIIDDDLLEKYGNIYEAQIAQNQRDNYLNPTDSFNLSTNNQFIQEENSTLNKKDEKEIEKIIENTINDLESADGLMFDGKPANEEELEQIKSAMRIGLAMAKEKAREKFTPKKYRNK